MLSARQQTYLLAALAQNTRFRKIRWTDADGTGVTFRSSWGNWESLELTKATDGGLCCKACHGPTGSLCIIGTGGDYDKAAPDYEEIQGITETRLKELWDWVIARSVPAQ